MQIVYILSNLNRTAPNTVMVNIIKYLQADISVISLGKSSNDTYRDFFKERNIKVFETKNLFTIISICKNKVIHLNGYHPNIAGLFIKLFAMPQKIVATCHSNEKAESQALGFQGITLLKSKLKQLLQPKLYNLCDEVVAVSKEVQNYLKNSGIANTCLIYNGIKILDFEIIKDKGINICQIGHIMPLKNQLYSLKLLTFLLENGVNAKLNFFGGIRDFGYEMQLLQYIENHTLQNNVKFFGNLHFEHLFSNVSKHQICIMPSLSEGMPLSLLEALSLEVPCIVSSHGGMKEAIIEGINGLVIDLENKNDMWKILHYIQTNQFDNERYSAKKYVFDNFNEYNMALKYRNLYLESRNV